MTTQEFHDLRRAGHNVAARGMIVNKFVRPAFAMRIGEIDQYNGVDYKVASFIDDTDDSGHTLEYAVMERVTPCECASRCTTCQAPGTPECSGISG